MPASYTAEDIKKNVTVDVETPTIPKTNTRQELTGASYEITAPESVPGNGMITITSGSRKVKKTYNVNFTARSSIQPEVSDIEENGNNISVPVTNESSSVSVEACALAVVKTTMEYVQVRLLLSNAVLVRVIQQHLILTSKKKVIVR